MPIVAAVFVRHRQRPRVVGRSRAASAPTPRRCAGVLRSTCTAANVIVTGQDGAVLALVPEVVERGARDEAAGAGCGPGERVQAVRRTRAASARDRPGGTRPRRCGGRTRSWVRSSGVDRFAWLARSCIRSLPTSSPRLAACSSTQPPPSRATRRAEDRVADPRVVADERRRLVRDLVGGAGEADGVEVVEAVVHAGLRGCAHHLTRASAPPPGGFVMVP